MRDRHQHQVEDLRATLEASLNAPDARPSRWTPQLVDMRRQQKRLVRERKFGEALDLLKAAETREKSGGRYFSHAHSRAIVAKRSRDASSSPPACSTSSADALPWASRRSICARAR